MECCLFVFIASSSKMPPVRRTRVDRFAGRMWKVPMHKRDRNCACSICLEEFLDSSSRMVILACDHVFHSSCYKKEIDAYLQRTGLSEFPVLYRTYHKLGAPCPLCRLQFPLRHYACLEMKLCDLTELPV